MNTYLLPTLFRFVRVLLVLIIIGYVATLLAFTLTGAGQEHPLKPDLHIEGPWKFRIGDNATWKETSYDDSDWSSIPVPSTWETSGYDHDGFAWYRTALVLPKELRNKRLVILLGKIDDIDQLYINGQLVSATGIFESEPIVKGTEWQEMRGYYVPNHVWEEEATNLIAIRVYDHGGYGGLFEGPIGIISQKNYIRYWKERKKRNR